MDRIAAAARASKPLIYLYFGNKEELFDAVISRYIEHLTETVPFTAEDLGAYAGAMYDYMLANPESLRLVGWGNFERPEPTATELRSYRRKLDSVAAAQTEGRLTSAFPPADLLAMTLGLVTSWIGASPALKAASGRSPMSGRRLAEYRESLVRAVRELSRPSL